MSMESAIEVLCDPAVLGLEAALLTAWALAEIHMQRHANTAKEYVVCVHDGCSGWHSCGT